MDTRVHDMFPPAALFIFFSQRIYAHELNAHLRGACSPGLEGSPSYSPCGDKLASCQLSQRAAGEQHLTAERQLGRPHFQRLRERGREIAKPSKLLCGLERELCELQAGIGGGKDSYLVPASHPHTRRDEDGSRGGHPWRLGQVRIAGAATVFQGRCRCPLCLDEAEYFWTQREKNITACLLSKYKHRKAKVIFVNMAEQLIKWHMI